jgi:hypothetical protein
VFDALGGALEIYFLFLFLFSFSCDTGDGCHTCDVCHTCLKYHWHVSLVIKCAVGGVILINLGGIGCWWGQKVFSRLCCRPKAKHKWSGA